MHWCAPSHVAVAFRHRQQFSDGKIRVFDAQRPDRPSEFEVIGQPTAVRWLPRSSDRFVVGTAFGDLMLYDTRSGLVSRTVRKGKCHSAQIVSLLFPASTKLLSVADDSVVMLWDVDSLASPLAKAKLAVTAGAPLPLPPTTACLDDGRALIVGFEDGTVAKRSVEIREGESKRPVMMSVITEKTVEHGMVTTMAYRPRKHGRKGHLAVGTLDGTLMLWTGEKCDQRIEGLVDGITACAW
jgi:WD40 repeat protein